jgi:glycosyltransferase involved in cell wall biosynthesis
MYKGKTICAVVPAHNEQILIVRVITTMPECVDRIVIVNDGSTDGTEAAVKATMSDNPRVDLVTQANQGVGGAIATGYKWARDHDMDIAVVMAGDAQMDPSDLPALLEPVANEEADYTKGNRLFTGETYHLIPKVRYFGNSVLSMLTKIASGYWHVADSQSGYTVTNRNVLRMIDWDTMYKRYGQPNDLLVRLNVYEFRVRDVPIKAVYRIGEKSGIRIRKVMFTIPWMLLKLFVWRMKEKYVIRDFHPLVFFYLLGLVFSIATMVLFARLVTFWYLDGRIPPINALAAMFSFVSASQFTLFAMWFDMESNKRLR